MDKYIIYSYLSFLENIIIIGGISSILVGSCYILGVNNWYFEKSTSYECGFDPFSDTREPFDIKFYLIAILFIIFDVEVVFFIPWVICQKDIGIGGYYTMYLFYILLLIGYYYEYKKGTLDWS